MKLPKAIKDLKDAIKIVLLPDRQDRLKRHLATMSKCQSMDREMTLSEVIDYQYASGASSKLEEEIKTLKRIVEALEQ